MKKTFEQIIEHINTLNNDTMMASTSTMDFADYSQEIPKAQEYIKEHGLKLKIEKTFCGYQIDKIA